MACKAVLVVVIAAACAAGCGGTSPPPAPTVKFGKGIANEERDKNTAWRWMLEEGTVRLKNAKRDMALTLVARVPDAVKQPNITVTFNGSTLDQFAAPKGVFKKEYSIDASRQGPDNWSELQLKTDKTFIPKDHEKSSRDERHLGLKIHELSWEPK